MCLMQYKELMVTEQITEQLSRGGVFRTLSNTYYGAFCTKKNA